MNATLARPLRLLCSRLSIVLAGLPCFAEADVIAYNFSEASTNDSQVLDTVTPKGPLATSLWNDSYTRTTGTVATGSETGLVDKNGVVTSAAISWSSSGTWYTAGSPGTLGDPAVQDMRIVLGYLDDGGTGVSVTVTGIPYSSYRVYGIVSSDQSGSSSTYTARDFRINGASWAFGGAAAANTTALKDMTASSANGAWIEIVPGVTPGNYFKVSGLTSPTLTIQGQSSSGGARGSLAAIIIESSEDIEPDGMPDDWEQSNGLVVGTNDADLDADMDGLSNLEEYENRTLAQVKDTDGDGLEDGPEVKTHGTLPLVPDTDGDELSDGIEVNTYGTSPILADTDDDDLPDNWEIQHTLDPKDDGTGNVENGGFGDPDGDDLDNYSEYLLLTDPRDEDTDGDGLWDNDELLYFSEPLIPDTDGDGLSDGDEVHLHGTLPDEPDSDGDGVDDKLEIDAGFDPNDPDDTPTSTSPITWAVQKDLLSEADVSLEGDLVSAFVFGSPAAPDVPVTVGSETITFVQAGVAGAGNTGTFFTGNGGDTGNAGLNSLLDSHQAFETGAWGLVITGLVPGKTYQVQVIAGADRRTGISTRTQIFGDGVGNFTGDLTRGGPGTAIGTFTASQTGNQTIEVAPGSVDPIDPAMSALMLREVSANPPVVTSFTLSSATQEFTLTWRSADGASYDVETSPDLTDWTQTVNASPLPATGESTTFSFPKPADAKRFYRVSER